MQGVQVEQLIIFAMSLAAEVLEDQVWCSGSDKGCRDQCPYAFGSSL